MHSGTGNVTVHQHPSLPRKSKVEQQFQQQQLNQEDSSIGKSIFWFQISPLGGDHLKGI